MSCPASQTAELCVGFVAAQLGVAPKVSVALTPRSWASSTSRSSLVKL